MIVIGDGVNDLFMMVVVGLGFVFNVKFVVCEVVSFVIGLQDLFVVILLFFQFVVDLYFVVF